MRVAKNVLALVLVVLMGTSSVSVRAQTASSATVSGRVTDSSGAVVAAAQVRLRNVATNATRDQRCSTIRAQGPRREDWT